MCLPIAIQRPDDVLSRGEHCGFEFMVIHNGNGYRCGYVKVTPGHPWHGQGYDDVRAADGDFPGVHGGLTFAEADEPCARGGPDDGWWFGFDTAHGGDAPDPDLPSRLPSSLRMLRELGHVWTQPEVEAECRKLCEQAAAVAGRAVPASA